MEGLVIQVLGEVMSLMQQRRHPLMKEKSMTKTSLPKYMMKTSSIETVILAFIHLEERLEDRFDQTSPSTWKIERYFGR